MFLLLILSASTKLASRQGGGQDDVDTLRWQHVARRFPGILKRNKYQFLKNSKLSRLRDLKGIWGNGFWMFWLR